VAEADAQFTIFDLSALKKQCLSAPSKLGASYLFLSLNQKYCNYKHLIL
jgi:hypothetical protein